MVRDFCIPGRTFSVLSRFPTETLPHIPGAFGCLFLGFLHSQALRSTAVPILVDRLMTRRPNQSLQPAPSFRERAALWRCASMSFLIRLFQSLDDSRA